MNLRNSFRRTVTVFFIVAILLFTSVGIAEIKLYRATAEDYANEVESQDVAKLRARNKAIKNATKQAGVYLQSISRSINGTLTDDDILAITSNSWQLVGDVKYSSKVQEISDQTTIIVWTATVEVNIDDAEIQSWLKRDDKEKSTIITQTRKAQRASEENDALIEDLREKYKLATSQAEKDRIIKQMNDADRDFLANQKNDEGVRLYYAKDYHGAIKLFNEALKLKPDWDWAYNNRGEVYRKLKEYDKAFADYNKAIELNPNNALAYNNRGIAYALKGSFKKALEGFSRYIELVPNDAMAYQTRGLCYQQLGDEAKAQADFAKAHQLGWKG